MSPDTTLTNLTAKLRQRWFQNEQTVSQGTVLLSFREFRWRVTNRIKPTGTGLRVLNHKQIRSVIANGGEPVLDEKTLKHIGYHLGLKCRDVEFLGFPCVMTRAVDENTVAWIR